MTMKPYNLFSPMKPEQWEKNKDWLTKRSLFLIHLKDKSNEYFHGGDGNTLLEIMNNQKDSFQPEYEAIQTAYPDQFNEAFRLWIWELDQEAFGGETNFC